MPDLLLGPGCSVPSQSVWCASQHANIGADEFNLVVRLLSNRFWEKIRSPTWDKGLLWRLQCLYDLSRILSSDSVDVPSNKVSVPLTVAAEAAVNAFRTVFHPYPSRQPLPDVHAELIYEVARSLFGLSRRINKPEFELELLKGACELGHLEACRFLLDRLQPEKARVDTWTEGRFCRLVQSRGRGRLQFLRRLMGILPMELVGGLVRSIARCGEAGDLEKCLPLLVDTLPLQSTISDVSLLVCCVTLNPQSMAMERTRISLEEYQRRGALSIARSQGPVLLIEAASQGHMKVFEYVQSFLNVDISERNEQGNSVLHASARPRNPDVFRHFLQRYRPPPEQVIGLYLSAFYVAFQKEKFEVCNILKRQMCEVSSADIDWRAHLCSCSAKSEQDEDRFDYHQWTVGDCHFERHECLLCSNAWTACLDNNLELLAFCLKHGLDFKQTKDDTESAYCHGRNAIQLLDAVVHNNCCYYGKPKHGHLAQVSCA